MISRSTDWISSSCTCEESHGAGKVTCSKNVIPEVQTLCFPGMDLVYSIEVAPCAVPAYVEASFGLDLPGSVSEEGAAAIETLLQCATGNDNVEWDHTTNHLTVTEKVELEDSTKSLELPVFTIPSGVGPDGVLSLKFKVSITGSWQELGVTLCVDVCIGISTSLLSCAPSHAFWNPEWTEYCGADLPDCGSFDHPLCVLSAGANIRGMLFNPPFELIEASQRLNLGGLCSPLSPPSVAAPVSLPSPPPPPSVAAPVSLHSPPPPPSVATFESLSPSSSPPTVVTLVVSAILSGSVDDFDGDAQLKYREGLASLLPNVKPSDITLTITPASIQVTATIIASDSPGLASAIASIDKTSITEAVAVKGGSITVMSATTNLQSAASPPGSDAGNDADSGFPWPIVAAVGGGASACLVLIAAALIYRRRRQQRSKTMPTTELQGPGSTYGGAAAVGVPVEASTPRLDPVEAITTTEVKQVSSPSGSR